MIDIVLDEMHRPGPFDFGDRGFVGALPKQGKVIAADKAAWHVPPARIPFGQRRTVLLAARVNVREVVRDALALQTITGEK